MGGGQVPPSHEDMTLTRKKPIIFVHMSHGGGTYWKNLAALNGEKVCGIVGDDVRKTIRRACAARRTMLEDIAGLAALYKPRWHMYGVHEIKRVPNTTCELEKEEKPSPK